MEQLQPGKYYHIYNRGNNREDLFQTADNYRHFLRLYEKYISSVAETFAWALMKNHFHLLVRIKEESEIGYYKSLNPDGSGDSVRFQTIPIPNQSVPATTDLSVSAHVNLSKSAAIDLSESAGPDRVPLKKPNPIRHFSHLFNAYAKYYNKLVHRTGALFQSPFKRIEITTEEYFKRLIVYIHTNPEHHGFTNDFKDYPWTSYKTMLSAKPTLLERDVVLGWFGDKANFVSVHKQKAEIIEEYWAIE